MSAADLFEDGFPHGTPQGYTDGCKSAACPAKADFGMSCRMAWQAERSDRRYRRIADEGAPPPVIALELGLSEPEQLAPAAAVAVAAWRVAQTATSSEELADAASKIALAGAGTVEEEPVPPRADVDLSRPARIRKWARESGMEVGVMGPLPRAVIAAYDEAHTLPAQSDEPKQERALVVDLPNPASVGSVTVETVQEVPEHTEHTSTPTVEVEVSTGAVLYPGPSIFGIDMGVTIPGFTPVRPDFGQAMVDVDVERARRIAVRLEQELALTEEKLEAAEAEVHTVTAALAREQKIAASAEAEAAALRRALADRARRGRGVGAFLRRVVSR